MRIETLDRAGFLDLLKRLQGSGYTSEDGTARVAELDAIAEIAAKANEAIGDASENAFPTHASQILDAMEWAFKLPSSGGLSVAQRQARLLAFSQTLPNATQPRVDAACDRYAGAGTTLETSRRVASGPNVAGDRVARIQPSSDGPARAGIEQVLSRAIPARMDDGRCGIDYLTFGVGVAQEDAAYAINPAEIVTPGPQWAPDVAPIAAGTAAVLSPAELREYQAQLLWKPCARGTATTFYAAHRSATAGQDPGQFIIAMGSIANGATATVDTADWSSCLVQAWGVISTLDVRLGGANEDFSNIALSERVWLAPKNLSASAGSFLSTPAGTNTLGIQLSGTQLQITNAMGAARNFVLLIRASAKFTTTQTADITSREAWINPHSVSNPCVRSLVAQTSIRSANASTNWTPTTFLGTTNRGAIRRILYTGPMQKSLYGNTEIPRTVILDSSINWTNRYLVVVPLSKASANIVAASAEPLTGRVGTYDSLAVPRVFFTGPGSLTATGAVPASYYCKEDWFSANTGYLYVAAEDGTLRYVHNPAVGNPEYGCAMFMVIATAQASSAASQAPAHATQVHAIDINEPQNFGVYAQGMGTVPNTYGLSTNKAVTCPPLGLICDGGAPRRPLSWMRELKWGYVDRVEVEYRQRIFGQRRRMISMVLPASASILIEPDAYDITSLDPIDYRDRFVWIEGRIGSGTSDIGAAPTANDAAWSKLALAMYTGPYGDQTYTYASLEFKFEFARSTSAPAFSRIIVRNTSGATLTLNALLECTGQLGLTDTRSYGA